MRYVELVPLNDEQCEAFIIDDLADYTAQLMRDEGLDRAAAAAKAQEFEPTLRGEHADASSLGHRRWTAVGANDVVGWLWVTPDEGHSRRSAFLYQLTVRPGFRRQGYGAALLSGLEQLLAGDGVVELRLNVFDGNLPAQMLYRRAGYRVERQLDGKRQLYKLLPSPV
jgi:ribosomal protein S18 acetylase RimI-like enzyme